MQTMVQIWQSMAMIKVACREQFPVDHPTEDYPGVDILVFEEKQVKILVHIQGIQLLCQIVS